MLYKTEIKAYFSDCFQNLQEEISKQKQEMEV